MSSTNKTNAINAVLNTAVATPRPGNAHVMQGGLYTGQMVMTENGPISVDELMERERIMNEWLRVRGIIEMHQIIEELPDGDIVIRIKRRRDAMIRMNGGTPQAQDYIVDFGADQDEEKK